MDRPSASTRSVFVQSTSNVMRSLTEGRVTGSPAPDTRFNHNPGAFASSISSSELASRLIASRRDPPRHKLPPPQGLPPPPLLELLPLPPPLLELLPAEAATAWGAPNGMHRHS